MVTIRGHGPDLAIPRSLPCSQSDASLREILSLRSHVVRTRVDGSELAIWLGSQIYKAPIIRTEPKHFDSVYALSRAIEFLPKRNWKRSHSEMLISGLRSGHWKGLAQAGDDAAGAIVSYTDYRLRPEKAEVEIGFCMTHPDWRRMGKLKRALGILVVMYFDWDFRVSTYEGNGPMAHLLRQLGFTLTLRIPDDRINGDATLYFTRTSGTPFNMTV